MKSDHLILSMFVILSIVAMVGIATAQEQQTSGPYKWTKCANLVQICGNCTYVNITSIVIPANGTSVLTSPIQMTKTDTVYNYTFCKTSELGNYVANWKANPTGVNDVGNWNFYVTTTGLDIPVGFLFLIIGIVYAVFFMGLYKRDITITLLGVFMLTFLGLFLLQFGLNIYKNWLTDAFSFITLGLAGYLGIIIAHEYIT